MELSQVFGGTPPAITQEVAKSVPLSKLDHAGYTLGIASLIAIAAMPAAVALYYYFNPVLCSFGFSPGYDDDGKFIGCFK